MTAPVFTPEDYAAVGASSTREVAPVAWGLWNPATGKLDHRCYQREVAARVGAENQSSRWRTLIAVPLFLHPGEQCDAAPSPNQSEA